MKKLIINADDFGLSRGINKGIIELFNSGVLTSASLMVNMPGFEDAVRSIRDNPGLGVGLHINVLRGRPVSPVEGVGSLCEGGFFHGNVNRLAALCYTGKRCLEEFAVECRAQIEKALSRGVRITHLDSEKHVHILSPLFKVLLTIAGEYGILKIRSINEIPYLGQRAGLGRVFKKQSYTALLLSCCSMINRRMLETYHVKSPDYFYGASVTGRMTLEGCIRVLSGLKKGTTELMCHPGYIDEEWQDPVLNRQKYYINAARQREMEVLRCLGARGVFKQYGISLSSYGQL
ncbi:MAG: ChbG/HpnK family deacetylase [Candidatus Omnitrophica bacterium]|nr:ChbG/HpnK family deacetylase [Candidatus Omnitrophota bacterium]